MSARAHFSSRPERARNLRLNSMLTDFSSRDQPWRRAPPRGPQAFQETARSSSARKGGLPLDTPRGASTPHRWRPRRPLGGCRKRPGGSLSLPRDRGARRRLPEAPPGGPQRPLRAFRLARQVASRREASWDKRASDWACRRGPTLPLPWRARLCESGVLRGGVHRRLHGGRREGHLLAATKALQVFALVAH